MKVISVIGQKGGSGKSTVTVHLAVCAEQAGLSAAIIDTDPQGSAHKWFERRSASTPGVVREIDADVLPNLITRARANDVDVLLVDTPGKAETMALAACELADLVLVGHFYGFWHSDARFGWFRRRGWWGQAPEPPSRWIGSP